MTFNNRFVNNSRESNQTNRSTNSGINFDFPSFNLDLNSITQAFNPRNYNIVNNWEELIGSTKSDNRCKDMGCESCGIRFSVFKRRRTCFDCNMDFCNQCLNKTVGSDRRNHCKRCIVFNSLPLNRNALNGLRARDLKWFLASKRIPSQMCTEKGELVDLIIQSVSPQTNSSNSSDYMRRFDNYNTNNERTGDQNQTHSHNNWPNHETEDIAVEPPIDSTNTYSNQTTDDVINAESEDRQKEPATEDNSKAYFNIDDLKNVEQLKELSVKQLKLILTRNFVDYKGCVEKEELLAKVLRLWNEKQKEKLQNIDEIPDINVCKICMESTIDCVLLDCGHMISCTNCGKRLSECPICRQYVIRVVHTFKS